MSTKLSFRARQLDPSKPMPIYLSEELPDLHEYSAINRAVPQMPSGMEKEEESEHHLQRAIVAGMVIPTPDVITIDPVDFERIYPADFKMPRQLIHVQPLSLEQDIPDYDLDSEDELWLNTESKDPNLTPYRFEQMMDRLEKITVCTLDDAKALVKRNEVSQDVFDYWVSKRLKTKHPLLLAVKTECRGGTSNSPYIAFRRRTEKMQTRKNRKNDEASYEKMLKLRRDLTRAVKLLEMVKRREKMKKDDLQLCIDIYEKRYQAKDFTGQLYAEYTAATTKTRPAFAPIYSNQFYHHTTSNLASHSNNWNSTSSSQNYSSIHLNHHLQNKRDFDGMSTSSSRKEKRQYKKRKHKAQREPVIKQETYDGLFSSDDEDLSTQLASESEDEGIYPFRRNRNCNYFKPYTTDFGDWPWESQPNSNLVDPKYRFSLTSLRHPRPRCIGFARRRVGRGGRIILDRASSSYDDVWSKLDFTILDNENTLKSASATAALTDRLTATANIVNDKTLLSNSNNNNDNISELNQSAVTTVSSSVLQQTNHFNNNLNNNNTNNNNSSNIVIKSENSKPTENNNVSNTNSNDDQSRVTTSSADHHQHHHNQKLDDFEQLLDSANASSNIINKNLVCKRSNNDIKVNSDGFHLNKTISASNSSISEISSNKSVLNSFNNPPDTNTTATPAVTTTTLTTGISSTNSASSALEFDFSPPVIAAVAATSTAITSSQFLVENENDFMYRDILDEIRDNEWLHFQPLSPPLSDTFEFESDFSLNVERKFAVELQLLDADNASSSNHETENTNCTSYLTQPMTFNCHNNSIEIHKTTTDLISDGIVSIKTEPMDEETKEDVQMTNCVDGVVDGGNDAEDEFSVLLNNLDYTKSLFDSPQIGCSEFKLINEKSLINKMNLSDAMETESSQLTSDIAIKMENDEQQNINSITPIAAVKDAPIAELQSHNYVLQYGSPVSTPPIIVQNDNVKYTTSNLNASITGSTKLIPQQFVNAGNTIISASASPSQQNKMQSIVYDNNTFVLTTTAPRKQLNGPADRGINQNQKIKQVYMLDLSQAPDKRKAIGALNDSNLIKKSYSELAISPQNILVSSLNSNLNSNNIGQQSQQFSLVHQKPIILGASTSTGTGTFMQSTTGGTTTNKIIVAPASQLSGNIGNIYMSTHGKLVIPSSNQQSIILDKMITTNQTSTPSQAQQQKIQQSPSNQQRVKMENKMNMLIESSGEKNIIYAKYNKNNKIFQNVIPVATANKQNSNSPQSTAKQISQIVSTQQQQQQQPQSINVVSTKPIQRIPAGTFAVQQQQQQQQQSQSQTQQTQILRSQQQFGTSSVNFQSTQATKIIQQQQQSNNNGSTVKSNDNSSSPR